MTSAKANTIANSVSDSTLIIVCNFFVLKIWIYSRKGKNAQIIKCCNVIFIFYIIKKLLIMLAIWPALAHYHAWWNNNIF